MELEEAFYVMAIIFMSLMLIILIALLVAIFVIRAKIVSIHDTIEEKFNLASTVANKSASAIKSVKKAVKKR